VSDRIRPLTSELIEHLPEPCRTCLFWELADAPRGPQPDRAVEVAEAKLLYHRAVELDWGPPGLLVRSDDRTLAFATFVPAEQAHRTRRLGSVPSDDALVLTTMWVDPDVRGTGIASALLRRVLRQAHDLGLRAVEATATRGGDGPCLVPEAFLLANGFVVHHQHVRHPLLRLDLRQTVRWQDAIEQALQGVRALLGRRDRRTAPSAS
jgi:GNAT superfamily N-acetyltransferase